MSRRFRDLEESQPAVAEDFCRAYLNAAFVFEVLRTLVWLTTQELIVMQASDCELIGSAMSQLFQSSDKGHKSNRLESLAEDITRVVQGLSRCELDYLNSQLCKDDILDSITRALHATSWFAEKQISFLIDDYSVTVVPEIAQRAYNAVLFRPGSECRILISSEGDGPTLSDSLNRKYREGRE